MKGAAAGAAVAVVVVGASAGLAAEPNLDNGAELFEMTCVTCHSPTKGKNGQGPSLHGIFGRTSGTVDGFKYSEPMRAARIVWTDETLGAFLAKPKTFIPGQKMLFGGLGRARDRADVIAYLKKVLSAD